MQEFSHGGDIVSFAKKINCKIEEVIDFSSNINFVKPNKIDFNQIEISSYPNYDELNSIIASYLGIKIDEFELFNGASSAIYEFFKFIKKDFITIYSPAYLEYKKISKILDKEIDLIDRFSQIDRGVKENSLVIFVNPSTPDGAYYEIEPFLKEWDKLNCTILIDESFLDFCKNCKSAIAFLDEFENLYILKSFTKFFSSAGIRIGAIISNQKNIKNLKKFQPPWKISALDSAYLINAIKDKEFINLTYGLNAKNYIELEKVLSQSNLFSKIYPSNANFILAKLKNITANKLQEKLKIKKILIRNCANFDFLDDSFVRFSVNKADDIKILTQIML